MGTDELQTALNKKRQAGTTGCSAGWGGGADLLSTTWTRGRIFAIIV